MRNPQVYDWDSAKEWIMKGRSKVSRPIYDRYLSVRLLEPDNPDSDISLNYRYKHMYHDPSCMKRKRIHWGNGDYSESLEPPVPGDWLSQNRNPIVVYKKGGIAELFHSGNHYPGNRRIMNDYAGGVIRVVGKRRVVKVIQPDDKVLVPKRRRKCSVCQGDKWIVYTCWENGIDSETLHLLQSTKTYEACNFRQDGHRAHVVRSSCGRCGGTGFGKATFERLDSYVWDQDVNLLVDMNKGKLIL